MHRQQQVQALLGDIANSGAHNEREDFNMTVKDIFETATSATSVCLNFCASRENALNDIIVDHEFLSDDNIDKYANMEVTFTYPRRKDVLDIYVIKDDALNSACQKLGAESVFYLNHRCDVMRHQYEEGSERLAAINEGRIDGFLRALALSGKFTSAEMDALTARYL